MRHTRFMLCSHTGKVIHFTHEAAQRLSCRLGGVAVYQCQHCKFWHTAKLKKRKRKKT